MSKPQIQATEPPDKPLLPQIAILIGTLTIILAGAWFLYMADAPYHPEGEWSEAGVRATD